MTPPGRYLTTHAPVKTIHTNLDQEIIQVTEDKLKLVLRDHVADLEQRKEWIAPLGVVLTLITVFATTTFKDALFLTSAVWNAIFVLVTIFSTAWLVKGIIALWKAPSVDSLVDKIKNKGTSAPLN